MQASRRIPSKEERRTLAERIIELSSPRLFKKENQHYIALQVGERPYCNAIALSWRKDRVSFYIPSSYLLTQATTEGLKPEHAQPRERLSEHKFYFYGLKPEDLRKHESLFRSIIDESIDFIKSQRPKGK